MDTIENKLQKQRMVQRQYKLNAKLKELLTNMHDDNKKYIESRKD